MVDTGMGMNEPVFIEPLFQKDRGDCAICCLVMLLGKTYPEIVAVAPPKAVTQGMWLKEIIAVALRLGTKLKRIQKFDLHESIGIMSLTPVPTHNGKVRRDAHVALLLEGKVYDPLAGRLWLDVDVFLQQERYTVSSLLVRED